MTAATKQKATQAVPSRGSIAPVTSSQLVATGSGHGLSDEIVTLAEPQGARAESVRALRTYLVAQHVHGGRRALAICAPSAGVGCTFVAANLSVALSQIGVKTLLIDGDLRAPAVNELIVPAGPVNGLRDCLASVDAGFSECIQHEVLPNLSIMYAGGVATNPQELLAGDRFRELMEVCLRDFDMTIIDTPPANGSADARRVSNVVGYSLIVARRNKSLIDDVKILVGELQGDHAVVVGTVLNED